MEGKSSVLTAADVKRMLPERRADSNKGDYGRAAIVAGDARYSGAAVLAAQGALSGGAGYTALCVPEKLSFLLMGRLPEALLLPLSRGKAWKFSAKRCGKILTYSAIAAGMGMGNTRQTAKVVAFFLQNYTGKLLIDADGLNALSSFFGTAETEKLFLAKRCEVLLTPHPAEFSRLTGQPMRRILENGENEAKKYAAENGVTVLLKGAAGAQTLITDGTRAVYNATGNSGQAKGGSGDTLSGLICSLSASGANLFEAACAGAYLAGKAAEIAVKTCGEYALTASRIAENFGAAFLSL
ncbi:MAG: NAD(P)H-hydrate dehydratase [Candidatus Scatosoma sp.]